MFSVRKLGRGGRSYINLRSMGDSMKRVCNSNQECGSGLNALTGETPVRTLVNHMYIFILFMQCTHAQKQASYEAGAGRSKSAPTVKLPQLTLMRLSPRSVNVSSIRPTSWPTFQYMVSEVQYGGKITDDLDRRMFKTYTQV